MFVRLQEQSFEPGREIEAFLDGRADTGALVTFTGTVRSSPEHPVETLALEHYPAMAKARIETIAAEAIARFSLADLGVIHRFGTLARGEVIVMVLALASHRKPAFEAAGFVMDFLKTDAPFWKRETGPEGTAWVEAKAEDNAARDRWEKKQ